MRAGNNTRLAQNYIQNYFALKNTKVHIQLKSLGKIFRKILLFRDLDS